jgi:hypothetical protein
MKKILFSLALVMGLAATSNAQLSAVDYTSDDFAAFKASKTYAVKTGNAAYDTELENAMKESWKITSYEMLDAKALDAKLIDKSASFIVSIVINTANRGQSYHYIALLNGGKKNLNKYGYDDMLAYGVVNHFVNEMENTDCAWRMRNIIESMVDAISIVQKNDIKGNSKKIVDGLRDIYNTKASKIKDRTLLIPDYMINGKLDKADIAGAYPFKYELCKREKIEKAIKEKSKEYYYFQPAITLNKSMFVFDPSNGEVVYFDYAIMGMYTKQSDLEDMVSVIKGGKK